MHPADCPAWEYSHHPAKDDVLPHRSREILVELRANQMDHQSVSQDTRAVHRQLFAELAPNECDYYAGNYRGDDFRCLKYYNVMIPSDPRVGVDSAVVRHELALLASDIDSLFASLDHLLALPLSRVSKERKLLSVVDSVCGVFVEFLRIHPYANGNGHVARFLIFAVLGRYGYWPKRWPLDERPPDPPYSRLISEYRDGNRDGFVRFVLMCILGEG